MTRTATFAFAATIALAGPTWAHCGSCGVEKTAEPNAGHDHAGHGHAGHGHAGHAGHAGHDHAAADTGAGGAGESPLAQAAAAHGMSEQELMQLWTEAMTPNEHHARLTPLAGDFEFTNTHWMTPDSEPTVTTGKAESRFILGGRYLRQVYTGDFLGQPFEGHGLTGYDNVQERYVGHWIDNMGTGIMSSVGDTDASGKRIHFLARYWDPMTERPSVAREVLTIESDDRHVLEMYHRDPVSGEEFRAMRLVATRVGDRAGERAGQ